jgi:hypothetical protein
MAFRILADVLVALHLAFVVFVVLGGFLVVWRWRVALIHIPCAIWGVLIEWAGWICPLTPLELKFRKLGGEAGYSGGFIDHYVIPLLYPPGLTREHQVWLGILVGGLNMAIYGYLSWRWLKGRRPCSETGD